MVLLQNSIILPIACDFIDDDNAQVTPEALDQLDWVIGAGPSHLMEVWTGAGFLMSDNMLYSMCLCLQKKTQ